MGRAALARLARRGLAARARRVRRRGCDARSRGEPGDGRGPGVRRPLGRLGRGARAPAPVGHVDPCAPRAGRSRVRALGRTHPRHRARAGTAADGTEPLRGAGRADDGRRLAGPGRALACRGSSVSDELEASEGVARRASALLEPWDPADEILCHGDVDQKNLLAAAAGPLLCDWDVVLPRLPAHDLAEAAMSMACWRSRDAAAAVIDGYRDGGGVVGELAPQDLGPSLASRLGWIRFSVDRSLDARTDGRPARRRTRRRRPARRPGAPTGRGGVLDGLAGNTAPARRDGIVKHGVLQGPSLLGCTETRVFSAHSGSEADGTTVRLPPKPCRSRSPSRGAGPVLGMAVTCSTA